MLLACIPLFIIPPVSVIIIIILRLPRKPIDLTQTEWKKIIFVAILNIFFSLIIWNEFYDHAQRLFAFLVYFFNLKHNRETNIPTPV